MKQLNKPILIMFLLMITTSTYLNAFNLNNTIINNNNLSINFKNVLYNTCYTFKNDKTKEYCYNYHINYSNNVKSFLFSKSIDKNSPKQVIDFVKENIFLDYITIFETYHSIAIPSELKINLFKMINNKKEQYYFTDTKSKYDFVYKKQEVYKKFLNNFVFAIIKDDLPKINYK